MSSFLDRYKWLVLFLVAFRKASRRRKEISLIRILAMQRFGLMGKFSGVILDRMRKLMLLFLFWKNRRVLICMHRRITIVSTIIVAIVERGYIVVNRDRKLLRSFACYNRILVVLVLPLIIVTSCLILVLIRRMDSSRRLRLVSIAFPR